MTTATISYNGTDGSDGAACLWTVPDGVTSATFTAYGAQGGSVTDPSRSNLNANGGDGGQAVGRFGVTPETTWTIAVGGQGGSATPTSAGGAGGFNGGGTGWAGAAGGGGATTILDPSANVAVVAGGGGGANYGSQSGAGGGSTGQNGGCQGGQPPSQCTSTSGGGGTSTAPGAGEALYAFCSGAAGGSGTGPASSSGPGAGGAGGNCSTLGSIAGGPGGGGGYYGGGGGSADAAGGGSGFVASPNQYSSLTQGGHAGNGEVTIQYVVKNTATTLTNDHPNGVDLSNGTVTVTFTASVVINGTFPANEGSVTFIDTNTHDTLCSIVAVATSGTNEGQATCQVQYELNASSPDNRQGNYTIEADFVDPTHDLAPSFDTNAISVGNPYYSPDSKTLDLTVGVPMTQYTVPTPVCAPTCTAFGASTPPISGIVPGTLTSGSFTVTGTPGSGTAGSYTNINDPNYIWTANASNGITPEATFTLNFNIASEDTTTSVAATTPASGPSTFGQAVTFTATVTPADSTETLTPTGTVDFKNGTTTICSARSLTAVSPATTPPTATATCTTSTLSAGDYSVNAAYTPANSDFNGSSSSSAASLTVDPATITVNVSGSEVYGGPATFTQNSTPPNGVTLAGSVTCTTVNSGTAVGTLAVGIYTVDGSSCSGLTPSDANDYTVSYVGVTDGFEVVRADTTTTLALTDPATGNPIYGQQVTFTATVVANSPSSATVNEGSVTFTDNGNQAAQVAVTNGKASFTYSAGTAPLSSFTGTHSMEAVYSDTASTPENFNGSDNTASPLSVTVDEAPTQTTLASSANPSVYGQALTFTATVGLPSGSPSSFPPGDRGVVTFTDTTTNTVFCSAVSLSNGSATCSLTTGQVAAMAGGAHTIEADYTDSGDSIAVVYKDSSDTLSQAVGAAPTTTVSSTSVSDNGPGLVVNIRATVTANAPAQFNPNSEGTVTFSDSQGTLCTVALSGNTADCVTTAVTPGGGEITVTYNGDANFAASSTTTDATSALGAPVIVSITLVNDPQWLLTGGGFTGTSSVTVCGAAVPFTVLDAQSLLIGMPALPGPQQCTIVVVAAGGTATGNVLLLAMPVPGSPIAVYPGSSSSGGSTGSGCTNLDTLSLTGQWTLVAWPGAAMSPAQALAASADGCTTDVSSKIAVIWGFDAATQTWQAFFPGVTAPGANDLTQLQPGMGYFVALVDPSTAVSWLVETS